MQTSKYIYMNGKYIPWKKANIHILTHALHYGTAIFEGIRCYNTVNGPAVFRLSDHLKRLKNGVKSYQFELKYTVPQMCNVVKTLLKKNKLKTAYIRPLVFTGYKTIGLDIRGCHFNFAIATIPFGRYFGEKAEKGITCMISTWRRLSGNVLSPHVKASANYLNSVLARKEANDNGFDEAIELLPNGHVSEGTGENLFIVKDWELHTPPSHDGILSGITRDSVIRIARDMGMKVHERSMLRDELYTADEVFLCGTAAEVTPVRQVDHRTVTKGMGPVTKKLRKRFFNIVNGEDGQYSEWLEYVK